jgi:hypothetical protein
MLRPALSAMARRFVALGWILIIGFAAPARAQITPAQASQIQGSIGDRIEALTILGGDYGLAGGTFRSTGKFQFGGSDNAELVVSKLGGSGDIGDPRPLDGLDIAWQPRVQGNLGYLEASNDFQSDLLDGDVSRFTSYALELGGGARFWLTKSFSLAPTLTGLYGHTTNSYLANSEFMRANLTHATQIGLVDWSVDTFTLRPALNAQYVINYGRAIVTLSSDGAFFRTGSFSSSNSNVRVDGNSGSLANTIDVDVPLGKELFGHELRAGGYFSRTDLFGDLKTGLDVEHLYEIHGRLVLDFLHQFWQVKWIGIGGSYVWGPNITGWTAGADITFQF